MIWLIRRMLRYLKTRPFSPCLAPKSSFHNEVFLSLR